ncbi:lysozyme [Labrys miyagiensis]
MRVSGLFALVGACLFLAGCGGTTSALRPSAADSTGSIVDVDAPLPPATVSQPMPRRPLVADDGVQVPVAREPDDPVPQVRRLPRQAATSQQVAFVSIPPVRPDADAASDAPAPRGFTRDRIYSRRFRDAKPINFGRASPRVFAVHGVDVSRWQGDIDWQTLRLQGANFAFIKATDGGDHLDPMFRRNWQAAHEAGLKRGAYHFFYWCRNAAEQARWFIRNVPRVPGALPPVVDVEWNADSACKIRLSPAQVQEKMRVFISMVERHYGQRPIIYTAPGFYHDNLEGAFMEYPFWLRSVAQHPAKVFEDRKWIFWQYSGSGLSHGVDGKIDLNVFNGSAEAWYRWVGANAG